jgi:hypothetical protein
MHLKVLRASKIRIEFLRMFIWLDDCADTQAVDVYALEALGETVGDAFHADFAGCVDVHGLSGGGFGEREVGVVDGAFGVGYAVGGDGGGEDDFLDAEFAG